MILSSNFRYMVDHLALFLWSDTTFLGKYRYTSSPRAYLFSYTHVVSWRRWKIQRPILFMHFQSRQGCRQQQAWDQEQRPTTEFVDQGECMLCCMRLIRSKSLSWCSTHGNRSSSPTMIHASIESAKVRINGGRVAHHFDKLQVVVLYVSTDWWNSWKPKKARRDIRECCHEEGWEDDEGSQKLWLCL